MLGWANLRPRMWVWVVTELLTWSDGAIGITPSGAQMRGRTSSSRPCPTHPAALPWGAEQTFLLQSSRTSYPRASKGQAGSAGPSNLNTHSSYGNTGHDINTDPNYSRNTNPDITLCGILGPEVTMALWQTRSWASAQPLVVTGDIDINSMLLQ